MLWELGPPPALSPISMLSVMQYALHGRLAWQLWAERREAGRERERGRERVGREREGRRERERERRKKKKLDEQRE